MASNLTEADESFRSRFDGLGGMTDNPVFAVKPTPSGSHFMISPSSPDPLSAGTTAASQTPATGALSSSPQPDALTSGAATAVDFVRFALDCGVLRFGSFKVKSGRISPYFFNAGLFNSGASVGRLGAFYAQALIDSGVEFDMLFGPAYKGIPLATTTSVALAAHPRMAGRDIPFAFNRKEAKDHGEGGVLVGAPLNGRVVIIDDVITAGTSVRESVEMIRAAGAQPQAVLIAMDRMERAGPDGALSAHSAVQEVGQRYGIPVVAIASLKHILALLDDAEEFKAHRDTVLAYRAQYGVVG